MKEGRRLGLRAPRWPQEPCGRPGWKQPARHSGPAQSSHPLADVPFCASAAQGGLWGRSAEGPGGYSPYGA